MLTREEALTKHREMWSAMREKLGDNPCLDDRDDFKEEWCREHDGDNIDNCCYLCQYDNEHWGLTNPFCSERCLIDWGGAGGCISGDVSYMDSSISEILALPRRKVSE